jgi:cytochrome b involved in lipid metabolism
VEGKVGAHLGLFPPPVLVSVCWLQVYDVSPYVDEHPGGIVILNNAGGDATDGFNKGQHPENVKENILPEFLIGVLKQ